MIRSSASSMMLDLFVEGLLINNFQNVEIKSSRTLVCVENIAAYHSLVLSLVAFSPMLCQVL